MFSEHTQTDYYAHLLHASPVHREGTEQFGYPKYDGIQFPSGMVISTQAAVYYMNSFPAVENMRSWAAQEEQWINAGTPYVSLLGVSAPLTKPSPELLPFYANPKAFGG